MIVQTPRETSVSLDWELDSAGIAGHNIELRPVSGEESLLWDDVGWWMMADIWWTKDGCVDKYDDGEHDNFDDFDDVVQGNSFTSSRRDKEWTRQE